MEFFSIGLWVFEYEIWILSKLSPNDWWIPQRESICSLLRNNALTLGWMIFELNKENILVREFNWWFSCAFFKTSCTPRHSIHKMTWWSIQTTHNLEVKTILLNHSKKSLILHLIIFRWRMRFVVVCYLSFTSSFNWSMSKHTQ